MAWRRPGDKPLSEPMIISLMTNICAKRPQWVSKVARKIPKDVTKTEMSFSVTGCKMTINFQCSQRWKFRQNDEISVFNIQVK